MSRQISLVRISELLARFSVQVSIQNANAMYDLNIIAEDLLIPILNIAYACNLTNAKYLEKNNNFPGIDLLDKNKKIAFQVTSTSSLAKVTHTIFQILKNNLNDDFSTFYLYIVTKKQETYNAAKIKEATQEIIEFNDSHILDQDDIFKKISQLGLDKIYEIETILEKELGDSKKTDNLITSQIPVVIESLRTDFNHAYLSEELKGEYEARMAWLKRKNFLTKEQPLIIDTTQKYSTNQHIIECEDKISEVDKSIASILVKIKNISNGR